MTPFSWNGLCGLYFFFFLIPSWHDDDNDEGYDERNDADINVYYYWNSRIVSREWIERELQC